MAIGFGAAGNPSNQSSGSTSFSFSWTGASAGQLAIADAYTGGPVTWPSGWTVLTNLAPGSFVSGASTAYKILNSTDISSGTTLTTTTSAFWGVTWSTYSGSAPRVDSSAYNSGSASSLSVSLAASNSTDWLVGGSLSFAPGGTWSGTSAISSSRTGLTFLTSAAMQVFDTGGTVAQGSYTETFSGSTVAYVRVVAVTDVSAPSAPTLSTPASGTYQSVSSGFTCTAVYNSTDSQNQNAYAAECKQSGGSYSYYNAGTNAFQGTIVWNSVSTAPGNPWSWTFPAASPVVNGVTLNWSAASQEAGGNLQGSFASAFTLVAQAAPTLVVNSPTGTVGVPEPTVTWTTTPAGGASQTTYRVVIYTAAQQSVGGFAPGVSPSTWDSGTLAGSASSLVVGVMLANTTTYYAYVIVAETGGEMSAWEFTSFTVTFDPAATPTVTAAAGTDPTTGCPRIAVTVQGNDNILSYNDASFETGTGTWQGNNPNSSISTSTAHAKDGSHSMLITPVAAGNAGAAGGFFYPITANQTYIVQAAFWAGTTPRSCTIDINWFTSAMVGISTTTSAPVTDSTSAWTVATENVLAPSNAAYFTLGAVIASTSGSSDVHYVDCVGVQPSTASVWARGGLVGTTNASILRSDGNYVRNASLGNPASFPDAVSLADSSAHNANLASSFNVSVEASPVGAAFGQAALFGAGGSLLGASGTTNAQGAVTGSAWTCEFRFTPGIPQSTDMEVMSRAAGGEWLIGISGTTTGGGADVGKLEIDWAGAFVGFSSAALTAGNTYAIELSWNGTQLFLFINGTLDSTFTESTLPTATAVPLAIGTVGGLLATWAGTVIDEVRISNVARNTTTYTPATVPFVTDANTGCLYHLDAVLADEVVTVYDYEATSTVPYTYTAVVNSPTNSISSTASAPCASVALSNVGYWELDPTNYASAVNAQVTQWNPIVMEQSAAHLVMGQSVPNVVASVMGTPGFNAQFETFSASVYSSLESLLTSQKIIFVSNPYGFSYYVRFGPMPDNSSSSGYGSKVQDTKQQPSTAAGPYYQTTAQAVSQLRPAP